MKRAETVKVFSFCVFDLEAGEMRLTPYKASRDVIATAFGGGYPAAVARHFGANIDYAVLTSPTKAACPLSKPSPAVCTGATTQVVCGSPDLDKISTSHVERSNLTLRMGSRRFTRLANAFSKKFENHMHAVSFYFMVYNFVKVHSSERCSPAMAAGVTNTLWSIEDIVMMADTMA